MLNEIEIDQLRQLVHFYSLSDVLRGLQHAAKLDAESYREGAKDCKSGRHPGCCNRSAARWDEAATTLGRAARNVFKLVG